MSKSSNFFGQPIYGQLLKSLDREKIVEMSRQENNCITVGVHSLIWHNLQSVLP